MTSLHAGDYVCMVCTYIVSTGIVMQHHFEGRGEISISGVLADHLPAVETEALDDYVGTWVSRLTFEAN